MKIILASSSPRRLQLLADEGLEFQVMAPDIDEKRIGFESPQAYVCRLAETKARAINDGDSLIIGADTVVILGDEFLNKPASELEARLILEKLSGRTHVVFTGLSLVCAGCGRASTAFDSTKVSFNVLTETAILKYIKSGEPLDKAGAYGIQGMGSFLVKEISGELDTVVGFPTKLFRKMIEEHRQCLQRV